MNKFFNCPQVIIFTVVNFIALILTIMMTQKQLLSQGITQPKKTIIVSQVMSLLIGYVIMHMLCEQGYNQIAWLILLTPIVLPFLLSFLDL